MLSDFTITRAASPLHGDAPGFTPIAIIEGSDFRARVEYKPVQFGFPVQSKYGNVFIGLGPAYKGTTEFSLASKSSGLELAFTENIDRDLDGDIDYIQEEVWSIEGYIRLIPKANSTYAGKIFKGEGLKGSVIDLDAGSTNSGMLNIPIGSDLSMTTNAVIKNLALDPQSIYDGYISSGFKYLLTELWRPEGGYFTQPHLGPSYGFVPDLIPDSFSRMAIFKFSKDVLRKDIFRSEHRDAITGVLERIGDYEARISDVVRTPREQAKAMYNSYLLPAAPFTPKEGGRTYTGVEAGFQRILSEYGKGGDMVARYLKKNLLVKDGEWISRNQLSKIKKEIIIEGEKYINKLHYEQGVDVSRHIQYPDSRNYAIDISPSSIAESLWPGFVSEMKALKEQGVISNFIYPRDPSGSYAGGSPTEKAFHVEFPL